MISGRVPFLSPRQQRFDYTLCRLPTCFQNNVIVQQPQRKRHKGFEVGWRSRPF